LKTKASSILQRISNSFRDMPLNTEVVPGNNNNLYCEQ